MNINNTFMIQERNFSRLSDSELIEGLTAVPANDKLHEYFFRKKCKRFLTYISSTLYNDENSDALVGELYEYLSNDNWKVLKMWESKNGCSLNSYLASCSLYHFTNKVKAEKKRHEFEITPSTPDVIENLNHFVVEDEIEMPPVWDAYKMLKERDQVILRVLVIEGKDMLEVAPDIWQYIRTDRSLNELSNKSIQSVIAMAKHRALMALMNKLNVLRNN